MATKRPLNKCNNCNYTWYPRGRNLSRKCPRCHSRNVNYAPLLLGRSDVTVILIVLFIGFIILIARGRDSTIQSTERAPSTTRKQSPTPRKTRPAPVEKNTRVQKSFASQEIPLEKKPISPPKQVGTSYDGEYILTEYNRIIPFEDTSKVKDTSKVIEYREEAVNYELFSEETVLPTVLIAKEEFIIPLKNGMCRIPEGYSFDVLRRKRGKALIKFKHREYEVAEQSIIGCIVIPRQADSEEAVSEISYRYCLRCGAKIRTPAPGDQGSAHDCVVGGE